MRMQTIASVLAFVVVLSSPPRPAAALQAETGVPAQMLVSVEPKKGSEIPAISQRDIIVHQGRDVRPVTDWIPAAANYGGLELAILIDDGTGSNVALQLNDIRKFIQEQGPATKVATGYMQNGRVVTTQKFTTDHEAAAKSLRLPLGYYGASASPYTALSDFIKHWPADPSTPRREVLMVTPGIDPLYLGTFPDPYVDAAVEDAQCAGVVVYSIYAPGAGHYGHSHWLDYWGQNFLAQLSEETGGEAYYFLGTQGAVSFAPYLDKLNRQLSNQFLLKFAAEPAAKQSRERVTITSEIHSVDFVHADRVCVPASSGQ
jgi:hypothetical protein